MWGESPKILEHQMQNNENLEWVQSLSTGVDAYLDVKELRESDIPLTNTKGVFAQPLAEYVAAAVCYSTKNM